MNCGRKRLQLAQQIGHQLTSGAARHTRNVVNRFVRVKLNTLAARVRQRINNLRPNCKQPQLKHLKQPNWPSSYDNCIGFNHLAADMLSLLRIQPYVEQTPRSWLCQAACFVPGKRGSTARSEDPAGFCQTQRTNSDSLSVLSFQSSASGSAALRLVMLFQPGALLSSMLILMKCIWSAGTSSSA